jgi:hypothetical protein
MGTSKRRTYVPVPTRRDTDFVSTLRLTLIVTLTLSLLLLIPTNSSAITKADKRKGHAPNLHLTRVEVKEAERRLSEMGYWTGPVDGVIDGVTQTALVAFQKWEGRKVTGHLTREDFDAILNTTSPQAKEPGYKHVEVDIDRQVLLLTNDNGVVDRVLPISSGSGKRYNEKGIRDLAYTPRGRFRVYNKLSGWKRSPLGLLYYPNYFSGGLAIHGNPSVPHEPQSHGCIRIPMFASPEISKQLSVGTIVLIYDKQSFVSAKDWAEADRQKQTANIQ